MAQTAQIVNENSALVKSAPLTSINAAMSTGAGASQYWGATRANHALQVILGGTVAATTVNVNLDGSLDGVHWSTIGSWSLVGQSSGDTVWFTGKAAIYTRANLTSMSGGTAPTATAVIGAA